MTDMNLSSDMQTAFSEHLRENEINLSTDVSVQVLTTGFWPTYKNDDLNLPSEMLACIETFKAFYDKRTSHRRLRWVHQLGNAQVLGNFLPNGKKKQHDLVVSTYQACILLLFNNQVRFAHLWARGGHAWRSRVALTRVHSRVHSGVPTHGC